LVPLSPARNNPLYFTNWKIIPNGKVPIEVYSTLDEDTDLYSTISDIIFTVIDILSVHINSKWRWAPIKRIVACPFDQILEIYEELFTKFDIYYVYKPYRDNFQGNNIIILFVISVITAIIYRNVRCIK